MNNDERVEAMARAICDTEGYHPDRRDTTPDAHWKQYVKHANAAIVADPLTEEVKGLVEVLKITDKRCEALGWGEPTRRLIQEELKKWNG